uniref:hypothetical protein n=1 Tax=Plesiomonas sp. ZOR0011 TaxID=1339230 RepID=UPI001C494B25
LDTLPYTHFPGVLLQPLGHLTKFCAVAITFAHQQRTQRNIRKSVGRVNMKYSNFPPTAAKKGNLLKLETKKHEKIDFHPVMSSVLAE